MGSISEIHTYRTAGPYSDPSSTASVTVLPTPKPVPRVPTLEEALDGFRRDVLAAQFVIENARLEALGCVVTAQQTLKEAMLEHTLDGGDEGTPVFLEAQEQSSADADEFLA